MTKSIRCSTAPDELAEAYWLDRLSPPEAEPFESHYLLCPDCALQVEEVYDFIASLRVAFVEESVATGMRAAPN